MVGARLRRRAAQRSAAERRAPLSCISLHRIHEDWRRGRPRPVRVLENAQTGAVTGTGEQAALSLQSALAAQGLEDAFLHRRPLRFGQEQDATMESRRLPGAGTDSLRRLPAV